MTKIRLIPFIVLLFIAFSSYGQKIKYKDIFGLLSTKQYESAEPFLKKYIKENEDNPNAFLFMGIIFQDKASKADILKQTSMAVKYMDSAILYYDKAFKTIDDKEVRKNKEYYQTYNRRDLRTGEFGVKLSDIQFDIEKKIEGLRERIDKVKMIKYYFSLSDSLYKKSTVLYKSIQQDYPSEKQFYLRSDENVLKNLSILAVRFDSCLKAFENYQASSSNLGRTGYNQRLAVIDINDFKTDGLSQVDFYQEELKLWDYKKFAEKSKQVIEKEIVPLREELVNFDIEINKLRERLNTDSVSVRNDLTKVENKSLNERLKKFDVDPLPIEVFSLKSSDLLYRSALLENKVLKDSANVHLKLRAINEEMRLLNSLDSIASKLTSEDIDQKALDYNHFITNTFSSPVVLQSYVKALKEYAQREKRKKDEELALRSEALHWIVDGVDSIPLTSDRQHVKFKSLFTAEEKYTVGIHLKDSITASGYFYVITPNRTSSLKVNFPVDKTSFKQSTLPVTKATTFSDAAGQIYYIMFYSEKSVKEKYQATLAKIYRSDGLAWNNNYLLGFIPKEITFKPETGELVVKNETQQIVIDKNGKVLK